MKYKNTFPQLIIIAAALAISFQYLRPGLPETDDGLKMVVRASAFHQSFKDGHFPVRWLDRLNENYGYPVLNFLYPLPFYLAEPFNLIGFSAQNSVEILFVISTLVSGLVMYLWLKSKTDPPSALVGSLLYLLAPYRIIDLYQRGSLGESVAFAFIPLVFMFSDKYFKSKNISNLLLASLFFAATITSHNSLAFVFAPLFIFYWVVKFVHRSKKSLLKLLPSFKFILTALGLSAFFWLPALGELQFTRAGQTQIAQLSDQFQPFSEIVLLAGPVYLLAFGISVIFNKSAHNRLFQASFLLALILQLPLAQPLWGQLSLDRFIQFPIRLLAINLFVGSILATELIHKMKSKKSKLITGGVISILAFSTVVPDINNVQLKIHPQGFFESNFSTSTSQKEFTPIYANTDPTDHAVEEFEFLSEEQKYEVVETHTKTQEKYIQVLLEDDVNLVFNTHYFPGWTVYVDDNVVQPTIRNDGRIQIDLTPGRNKRRDVKLIWQETPLRQAANLISLISLTLVVITLIFYTTKKNYKKTSFLMSLLVITSSIIFTIIANQSKYQEIFDPVEMKQRYLDSQWVNPESKHPLGDHGLYSWAGWAYVHGENPVLVNSENPPLGKYLIGLGILSLKRPALVGSIFSLFFLASIYLLSKEIIKDKYLSVIPVALFSLERIYKSAFAVTMLDSLQIGFLTLAFLFLIKAKEKRVFFIPASLMLGAVLSTKFYAGGALVIASVLAFYLVTKKWQQLKYFLITLPLAFLVHLASYFNYFLYGNSFRNYLGVQKYIFEFYRSGTTHVPFGSYWMLVFINRWRVWWGPVWGQYYTLTTKEWQVTWVINTLAALGSIFLLAQKTFKLWFKGKSQIPSYHLLTSWLFFYSVFLSAIGGWPHYMLLFLPFSNILLIKLTIDHHQTIFTRIKKLKF